MHSIQCSVPFYTFVNAIKTDLLNEKNRIVSTCKPIHNNKEQSNYLDHSLLITLIFTSFKVPVISLWERFCRMYGIEQLYTNSDTLCNYCEARDVDKATEWISSSLNESIDGKYTIYY